MTTVVMASTGVYSMPLLHILAARGFAVARVPARPVNNGPGRPHTARCACRGLQTWPLYGVLAPSLRPPEAICQLRSLRRHRDHLRQMTVKHLQPRHQARDHMQRPLHHVLRDVPGVTGLRLLRASVAGARDPRTCAPYRA